MPIDPYLAAKLPLLEGLDFARLASDAALMERFMAFYADDTPWAQPSGISVHDDIVHDDGIDVPVRVYRPDGRARAGLLWLHGGGFQGGNLDMAESHVVAAELSARAQALVVSVDYRLAVDGVHFPAPVDDAVTAWRHLVQELDAATPVSIGGASAGAAIAVSAALRIGQETGRGADGLVLGYPFLHFPNPAIDPALAREMSTLPELVRFDAQSIAQMTAGYVGRITDVPPEALPGAARLHGLPRATIVVAEYDDLRPSGELFARQLHDSGVPNSLHLAMGMLHGHLNRLPALAEVDRTLRLFADALLAPGGPASDEVATTAVR